MYAKKNLRSPWTNKYDPPIRDGAVPSEKLRQQEVQANDVFDIYRDLYVQFFETKCFYALR